MRFDPRFLAALAIPAFALVAEDAHAAGGTAKLIQSESQEASGTWRVYVRIDLAKAPATPHVPMKFVFTKVAEYERTLVDGKTDPVETRTPLVNQSPTIESIDVGFADTATGTTYKNTKFDFQITRVRGYVAGEYKLSIRTSDGTEIAKDLALTLKGKNEVVDRRAMNFTSDPKVKKVDDGIDAGAKAAAPTGPAAGGNGDVEAVGDAPPFIPDSARVETEEEHGKVKPNSGCGCDIATDASYAPGLFAVIPFAMAAWRRSRRAKASERKA
jgi:hypothetical protein